MGSKNNPHNRTKTQKRLFKGEEVVPAKFITDTITFIGAKYSKGNKPVRDGEGNLLTWDQIERTE